ncbi:response regulator receiver and unknown domain protein [Thermovirga lienii DSM 17291]|uniref:Transcriptional regulatory protein n=1 Tax=Thermovirga lienii (strain ATCC BAA-1197 / DSM 17291 / Cas60314) TaxID=580340 RepID=G7V8H6_THELD|nr:response regulator [Thermovirga lienii]AER67437.1 response regulator receiver and unknown domain protein [Thermovirga lienii DSM 17291]
MTQRIRIFIVEDDPMVADILKRFVSTMKNFVVVGCSNNGEKALKDLQKTPVDLVFLDIFMPEMDGLQLLKELRSREVPVDVIVISAAQEPDTINQVIRSGAFDYIIKPFLFERLKASLETYEEYRKKLLSGKEVVSQEEVDRLLILRRAKSANCLPKGLNISTLKKVENLLEESPTPLSAEETARAIGISRVTARRYLEYLVDQGKAVVERNYGEIGRPINTYSSIK